MKKKCKKLSACPPEDYKGSISQWTIELIERGLWNGKGWYGDVKIEEKTYWDILEKCEKDEKTK